MDNSSSAWTTYSWMLYNILFTNSRCILSFDLCSFLCGWKTFHTQDESQDYIKRQQLRELAMLNSNFREESPGPSGSVSPFNTSGMKRAKTGRWKHMFIVAFVWFISGQETYGWESPSIHQNSAQLEEIRLTVFVGELYAWWVFFYFVFLTLWTSNKG